RRGVGLRLVRRLAHGRRACRSDPQEARRRGAHRHGARRRIPPRVDRMRRGRSLGTRLVAAMVLLSAVVLALGYVTTYVLVRRELQENALDNLRSRTDELRPAVASLVAASRGPDARLGSRLRALRAALRAGLKV